MRGTIKERFYRKFLKEDNGCWTWIGARVRDSYGCMLYERKNERAHRISWKLHVGQIPDDLLVCHKCDNPKCVNPEHLFLGDHKSNYSDMKTKGRVASFKGVNNPRRKLTEEMVLEIRRSQMKSKDIAIKFAISPITVSRVKRRINWSHV